MGCRNAAVKPDKNTTSTSASNPSPTRRRRPTQQDIAQATGLSQTTVSLVLNGVEPSSVSEEARQRVLKAAEQLGYVPNRMARNLQSARTRTLACIVPDITNPVYPALIRGFQTAADRAGYDTMIFDTDGAAEREQRALQWLAQGHVDGVLAVFFHIAETELQTAARGGMAVVRLESQRLPPSRDFDRLYIDSAAAARAMTQALIHKGHRRIAMLSCAVGPWAERQRGYEAAMKEAGLVPQILRAEDVSQAAGARAMSEALREGFDGSALFAANDLLAIGAMSALYAFGRRIPDQVAVAGFDDVPLAQWLQPALTTVSRNELALGRFAAELLVQRLEGSDGERPGQNFERPFELVMRESA